MSLLRADRVALNPIPWISVKADPSDPGSEDLWLFADPAFRKDYPRVLRAIRESGFAVTMMEVLDTQTLFDYRRMIDDAGLALAPGYASLALPEDHGVAFDPASAEGVRWFDGIRRKAEESLFFGLETIFLSPEVSFAPGVIRMMDEAATGAGHHPARLDRVIDMLGRAAEIFAEEGVRAGLHNHVGTWIETEEEIERTLAAIPTSLLGASFDLGHLEWAGMDSATMIARHADRLLDLHIKDLDLEVAAASRATPTSYGSARDQGLFREPGLGTMDLDGALAALPDGWDGWTIIEVDRATLPPEESARVSWEWVSARF
ncbi:sugar phosphate isomerase/epimerase family protein [Microbacterium indicum]|uniref:sugar phosphate isomerase/epimerase family protein n=1 Tax=Microbacterium indicum TaxID=358100 RepID=UPI00040397CA|nr:sugar phosphate isomerase/epimerase [Microbacterium indicum]